MKFSHRDESEDWNFFERVMENPWMYLTKSDTFILFQHTLEILCLNSQLFCEIKCEKLIMLKLGKKSIEYLPCPWYSMLSLIPLETKWISFFFSFMAHLYLPVGILKEDDGDNDDDGSKYLL